MLESMTFPDPVISVAVEPKTKADQDKLGQGLQRLAEEDPTFRVATDEETGQTLIAGMGELHLEIIVDRLKREFNVDANVGRPQVAYRETARKAVEKISGKFVRQTGGRGQYGHAVINLEPGEQGSGYEFVDKIVGGKIPKEYIGPVDLGIQEAMESGILGGYPVVDIRIELDRRLVPRRRLERDRVQGRGLDGLQGGDEARQAGAARADDGRRGRHARGVPRRRDGQPQLPPRPRRAPRAASATRSRSRRWSRWRRCSATRQTCAP